MSGVIKIGQGIVEMITEQLLERFGGDATHSAEQLEYMANAYLDDNFGSYGLCVKLSPGAFNLVGKRGEHIELNNYPHDLVMEAAPGVFIPEAMRSALAERLRVLEIQLGEVKDREDLIQRVNQFMAREMIPHSHRDVWQAKASYTPNDCEGYSWNVVVSIGRVNEKRESLTS